MRSIRKLILAATLALAMVAALALPASAGDAHVVVFRGQATLGTGLHFPGLSPGDTGTWQFSASGLSTSPVELCADEGTVGSVVSSFCSISASGTLGPVVAGQPLTGAWCGLSSGTGTADYTHSDGHSHLGGNVGWVASAGSVLVLVPGNAATGGDLDVVGLVQASGSSLATDCALSTGGATTFDVNGVAVVLG